MYGAVFLDKKLELLMNSETLEKRGIVSKRERRLISTE
jgi:hypothetical protein